MNKKKYIGEVNIFWEKLNLWLVDKNAECPLLGKLKNHMIKFMESSQSGKAAYTCVEQFYYTYLKIKEGYLHPDKLFESSLMLKCQERMQTSENEFYLMKEKLKKSRLEFEEELKGLEALSGDKLLNAYCDCEEKQRKLLKLENSVPAKIRLLPLDKIRATEKTSSLELIKRYRQIVNQDKETRKKREYYLQKLGEFLENLLAGNEKKILSMDRFINIESCWNEKLLGRLYQKLVKKSYIEAGRKELFISVFLGYEEEFENFILPIKWIKNTTRGRDASIETNLSALGYLLVGLKSLRQLEEFIDISERIKGLTQDIWEKNKESQTKKMTCIESQRIEDEQIELEDKREKIQGLREQNILDSYFTTEDKKVIADIFSKADGTRFAVENLRIKESYQSMLDIYSLICDTLGTQKK